MKLETRASTSKAHSWKARSSSDVRRSFRRAESLGIILPETQKHYRRGDGQDRARGSRRGRARRPGQIKQSKAMSGYDVLEATPHVAW